MTDLQSIGSNIRMAREMRNLTQEQLADKCGLARQAIIRIESGQSNFEINTLVAICQSLNCTIDIIIEPIN